MKACGWMAVAAVVSCLALGCQGETSGSESASNGESTSPQKLTVGIVFDSGGRGDKSFNDSAWAGVERAVSELGAEARPVESKNDKDYEANLEALAEQNTDIVFAIGYKMARALEDVAKRYPNVKFAIVDETVDLPNVRSLKFREEQGSFLAGYLAGLMTETNKIGFVGGMEGDLIKKFEVGYMAGAKTANPNIEILPAKYIASWDNVDKAKTAANVLFKSGADVVYHAAGRAGLGVIMAAKDAGKYAIGVDSDQDYLAEGNVLTSMIKRVDNAVFTTAKSVKNGTFAAGVDVYGLAEGGVDLSEMRFTRDKVGPERLAKLAEISKKISDGELTVPATQAEYDTYVAALR